MKLVKVKSTDLYDYIKDSELDLDIHFDMSDKIYARDEYLNQKDCKCDYKWIRKNIQDIYNNVWYEWVKDNYKIYLAKYHVTRDPIIFTWIDFETKLLLCTEWNYKSIACRQARMLYAETELRNRVLDRVEQTDLMNFLGSEWIVSNYLQYWVEWIVSWDTDWLFDFLLSTPWSKYEHTGLASKDYTVEGLPDCKTLWERLFYILFTWTFIDGWTTD